MGQFYWWGGERETRHGQKWAVWSIYSLGGRVLMGRRHQQQQQPKAAATTKYHPGNGTAKILRCYWSKTVAGYWLPPPEPAWALNSSLTPTE
jgi:hypothetical protein